MKKFVFGLAMATAFTSAMAVSANRVGPVSAYGALKANGSKLSGTCATYADKAVQVKGMSLFWSSGNTDATDFYTEKGIYRMVDEMGIEVVRFAMGAADEKFNSSGRSYTTGGENFQKALLRSVVNAAIEKDIYVIIDWHIESSTGYTSDAVKFFSYAAQEYGSYNNVIFEIWNEPTGDMTAVANHAKEVIPAIRKYSKNLILVGSPGYSSQPKACAEAGLEKIDTEGNFGCTLHFYAASHKIGGGYDTSAEDAMKLNVPVFATEWGTVNYDGAGSPDENSSNEWIAFMEKNGISWTNWNASAMDEGSSAFKSATIDNGLTFTTSGTYVASKMNKGSYTDCKLKNGNATEKTPYSTGVAAGTASTMIDDMEDGDRYNYIGGAWGAVVDVGDGGKSSISNTPIEDDFGKASFDVILPSDGGVNTSKYMAGLKDVKLAVGNLTYGPYALLVLDLKKDVSEFSDFSKCKTIRYKYKGASHNFRIETSEITDYNYHRVNKDYSKDWREVEISVDMLKQETWGKDSPPPQKALNLSTATRLGWEIKGAYPAPDAQNQPKYDYLYVDDVSCDGVSITASASDAPAAGSSNSVKPVSSSSGTIVNPGSSATAVNPGSSAGTVTPGVNASSAATVVSNSDLLVIDDVEDGDEVLKTTGTWYAYTEKEVGGLSSITNTYDATLPGYVVVFPGTADATNGTQGFVGLTGIVWNQGTYEESPFVALGLNVVADTSKGYDFSKCSGFSYRYKGSAHTFKIQDGQVQDYAYHHKEQREDASEWTTVVLSWNDLQQPETWGEPVELNHANIKKMSWEVIGYKGFDAQPTTDYLYVDDLKCIASTTAIKTAARAASGIKMSVAGKTLNVAVAQSGNVKVQIFDMMGHVVETMSQKMAAGNHAVSLENLSSGNYVVRVMNNSAVSSARVSIK